MVVAELPHTATGKLLKTSLRSHYKDHYLKARPGPASGPSSSEFARGARSEAKQEARASRVFGPRLPRRGAPRNDQLVICCAYPDHNEMPMDRKLLARGLRGRPSGLPRLWLFTDAQPAARPAPFVTPRCRAAAPASCCAMTTTRPRRARPGSRRRICRERRLLLVVAGDVRLAASAWCRGASARRTPARTYSPPRGLVTSSAHSARDLRRCGAGRRGLMFLSPAFGPRAIRRAGPGYAALGAMVGECLKRGPRRRRAGWYRRRSATASAAPASAIGAIGAKR